MPNLKVESPVLVEERNGVLIITINRPQAKNSINTAAAVAIGSALDTLDARNDLVAGVITGAGGTFCAGMDLKAFLAGERPSIPVRGFAGIVEKPSDKPLIAAIEGYAVAGGFEIALACDILVASHTAQFGLPEVKRGLVAAAGGLLRLPRRVPFHLAMEWALTGDFITAEQAFQASLVTHLTEPGEALSTAVALAEKISRNGPLAVRASKQIITRSFDWAQSEAFDKQRIISEPVRASNDAKEGARAFTEKRAPEWTGT